MNRRDTEVAITFWLFDMWEGTIGVWRDTPGSGHLGFWNGVSFILVSTLMFHGLRYRSIRHWEYPRPAFGVHVRP